ncbi:hypothetical protein [Escherichia coli]|uniref:hypothetical protein n=1 Tax=Escherichia coli TaxID=562 RepID=UPI0021507059|nr:hypothetical protein [Escherichia coli]MCR6171447.1 hypothetical protein [Escherichia coli]
MASAQKTMRKYGEQLITISQEISEATTVKNAHRMPGKRLRCYLGQSGLRGEALRAEVRHTGKDYVVKEGVYYSWPYGWEPEDFAIMMRRIFKRKSPFILIIFDELTLLFK